MSKKHRGYSNVMTVEDLNNNCKHQKEEDDETNDVLNMVSLQLDTLTQKIQEYHNKSEADDDYIKALEAEYISVKKAYNDIQNDLEAQKEYSTLTKMTSDKVKERVKEKVKLASNIEQLKSLPIEILRDMTKNRLSILKNNII